MSLKDSTIVPVLAVDDLDRAIGFYRDKLGLDVHRVEEDPTSALVQLRGEDAFLIYKSGYKQGETTAASFSVSDVERTVDELRGRGVKFEDYDLPGLKTDRGIATLGEMKGAWFKDSEGNTLAITDMQAERARKAA